LKRVKSRLDPFAKAGSQLIRRRFVDIPDLTAELYAALVEYLERSGDLRTLPFDASACPRATMNDLPQERIRWFLEVAKRTAHRDLTDLVKIGLFVKIGTRGKGAYYKLQRKGP